MENIKKTCLHSRHVDLGAQMSPFGGFDMPIQYSGIVEEHLAVRNSCGVFDVSHMGEVNISGSDAEKYVNHIFTNDVRDIPAGKILYGMMCNPQGGVVDDLLVYKRGDNNFFLVINAANIDKDMDWINSQAKGYDVEIDPLSDSISQLAVQGPDSESVMQQVLGITCSDLQFYTFKEEDLDGSHILVSRTGYTGEDGFEIYADDDTIRKMWDTLIGSGRALPCGLGCRDTLRFEVGLPLYGDELSDTISPIEAGLGIFVKLDKPEFIGKDVLAAQKENGAPRKLVGLELADRAIPRHGYEVVTDDGTVVGHVTTGYRGISVDKSIAAALIDAQYAAKGTSLNVRIRRKTFPATVTAKKFYKKSYKKMIYYSKTHEYARVEGNVAYIGISDYAQKALGNVVYVDMPEQGDDVTAGEEFGAVESVKAASDLFAPVSGAVIDINEALIDNPRLINEDAMANWIIEVEMDDPAELEDLMDEEAYKAFCAAEKH